jgi:hypothetical protein
VSESRADTVAASEIGSVAHVAWPGLAFLSATRLRNIQQTSCLQEWSLLSDTVDVECL